MQTDNASSFLSLREYHGIETISDEPDGNPTQFSTPGTILYYCIVPIKGVDAPEIYFVLFQIVEALGFVPFVFHASIVTARCASDNL